MADQKQVIESIGAEKWERLAELTEKPASELQSKYADFVDSLPRPLPKTQVTSTKAKKTTDDCTEKNFDISLLDVIGIRLGVKFCGDSSDWSADVKLCLLAFGDELSCYNLHLDSQNAEICLSPNFGIAKFQICVGLRGSNVCLYVKGEACFWAFGWHCADFNEQLFCFA